MATYRVSGTGQFGTLPASTNLPGSTPVVLLADNTLAAVPKFNTASNASGTFTCSPGGEAVALPIVTLDAAILGQLVLIDIAVNRWMAVLVTSVDTAGAAVGLPTGAGTSSRAVAVSALSGYIAPSTPVAESFTLQGVSVDGHAFFAGQRLPGFYASALSTVTALGHGVQALIEGAGAQWFIGTTP